MAPAPGAVAGGNGGEAALAAEAEEEEEAAEVENGAWPLQRTCEPWRFRCSPSGRSATAPPRRCVVSATTPRAGVEKAEPRDVVRRVAAAVAAKRNAAWLETWPCVCSASCRSIGSETTSATASSRPFVRRARRPGRGARPLPPAAVEAVTGDFVLLRRPVGGEAQRLARPSVRPGREGVARAALASRGAPGRGEALDVKTTSGRRGRGAVSGGTFPRTPGPAAAPGCGVC